MGESPSLLGWVDPVAAIILHTSIGDIDSVLVDGKFVKRRGQLVVPGYNSTRTRFLATAKRIQGIWKEMPFSDLAAGVPFLGPYLAATAETVDTLRGEGNGYGDLFI